MQLVRFAGKECDGIINQCGTQLAKRLERVLHDWCGDGRDSCVKYQIGDDVGDSDGFLTGSVSRCSLVG